MNLRGFTTRAVDALRAQSAARRMHRIERDPHLLAAVRRERFEFIVRYAAAHSRFYAKHYRGLDLSGPIDHRALPPVGKNLIMDRFDDVVTDARLRLADVEAHLEAAAGDECLHGEFHVMATGGTSGRRGAFVFSRRDWRWALAGFFRMNAATGIAPRVPRLRIAPILATGPLHMTARMSRSVDIGVHRMLRLDARTPLSELVRRLNAFQPDVLPGYPSIVALLADEQAAGRLRIRPRLVVTSSEVRTPDMERRITRAWGVQPYDVYASTESGILAVECEHHRGRHLLEDFAFVEVVDEDGRPVPDGQAGSRVWITNLFNRTQPLIRYEISDMVTLDASPCPCGRVTRRLVAIEGRCDDILPLPGRDGREVALHPLALRSPLAATPGLRQYQIVYDGRLRARVVPAEGCDSIELARRIDRTLNAKLDELGVALRLEVDLVAEIERTGGHAAKFKLVEYRPVAAPSAGARTGNAMSVTPPAGAREPAAS